MSECDCTALCGDDPRIAGNKNLMCASYVRVHGPGKDEADAARFRWLCANPDWRFIEKLCQSFVAESESEFCAALSAEIDKRRAA